MDHLVDCLIVDASGIGGAYPGTIWLARFVLEEGDPGFVPVRVSQQFKTVTRMSFCH